LQLSIVIPVYGNWWLTARCLRELDRLRSRTPTFETIVVDNASQDETPTAIAAFPWVRYLRHETNRNFAGACNAGARIAQAPVTLMLNNDAYPLGDALTPLLRAFDDTEVAIAGGALFFEDGVTQAAGLVLLPNAHWHYFCRNFPASLAAVAEPRQALAVSGAAMAVRTDWFVRNGGFDESFVNGFEDVDLCMRARGSGRAIAYVADARFAHYEAATAGRFDREAENERRFYDRWSKSLGPLPRTGRGEVGAIVIEQPRDENALLGAARADLEQALRAFGHPVARQRVALWQRVDRRFRRAASIGWFETPAAPGIELRSDAAHSLIRTHGAVALEVPWLPCAAPERIARLSVRRSDDPSCRAVGVVGANAPWLGDAAVRITPEMLLGDGGAELACVIHLGSTDEAAFGNVLLAQAGLPAVVLATERLRAIFAPDVAFMCGRDEVEDCVARLTADIDLRVRFGELVAADARRRFSPRRSAIRVVDLLCAARFGLERPGAARSDTPL
jgi:GT2 family glycosyltransferase